MAITVTHSKVSTIPDGDDSSLIRPSDWNDEHTLVGVGTAASLDAGVANGVATLDSGGTVPLSQIPASIIGGLNYQGTWNASTNTPTLTSSVGTKGYYYAVSVSGTTNLNGITDWTVGDLAVFNGTAWEQIDNTDAVTSVNGYTGTVVLGYADVGAFPATATTGTGSVVLQTNPTINTPTLSGATVDGTAPYLNYTPTTAPTYVEGRVFYDSTAKTLNYYNDNSQMSVNIGQEQIVRVRNQTGSTIADGTVVYVNGATGNTPTIAKAIATSFSTADIIGVTTTDIANNGFGYVTINGLVNGLDTSAFAEGDAVFLSATTAGAYTTTEPTRPNYSIQVGVVLRANPSNGTLLVSVQIVSCETQHIVGTVAVDQGGTGQTSYTNGQLLIGNTTGNTLTKSTLTAGTGVSVTNGTGSITLANTGVTSAVAGTGISVSSATGAVTVTNSAPDQTVVLTAGTGISTSGTYPNFTITNTAPSSGGTVTSVTGTAPIVSSGGNTPAISIPAATGSVNGYLTSTDWTTFNNKGSGTVTAVSVASANGFTGTSSGGATPALTLATSITGMLKGNGTAISAGTAGTDYVAPATATSFTAQQYFGNVALTDGATISWAANTAQVATFTFVSSNRTMGAPTGLVSGAYYGLAVIQNGGSNTLTWNSVFKWAGGTAPTLSTAAGAKDYFVFRTDGTNLYEQGRSLGVA